MSDIAHPSAPTCAVERCEICHTGQIAYNRFCQDCFRRIYGYAFPNCIMCSSTSRLVNGYCSACTSTMSTPISVRIQNRVVADKPLEPCEICHTNPIVSSRYCQECFDKHKSVQVLTEQISNVTMEDNSYECGGCGGDRTESRCGHCDMMDGDGCGCDYTDPCEDCKQTSAAEAHYDSEMDKLKGCITCEDFGHQCFNCSAAETGCCDGTDPKCPGCHPENVPGTCDRCDGIDPDCYVCEPESASPLKVPALGPCLHCDGWSNGSKCWCRAGMRSDYCCQRCETCIDDHKASPCRICHEIVSCGGDGMCWPCFDKCVAKTAPLISHIMGEPKSE